jgi:hypothetical protein
MPQVVKISLSVPKQSTPVMRDQREVAASQSATVAQSGCCIRVLGQCLLESPLC